jgi:hypothetical protein
MDGLREQLGGRRCPNDEAFVAALATEPLYSTAEKNTRLRLILERLERSFEHKEPADLAGAQIEHVMPQKLTQEWIEELGDKAEEQWAQLVHTLGNLTLTKYNAELSNNPYMAKRKELTSSHFVLNQYWANVERWNADAIRERGKNLAQRALKIWADVGRKSSTSDSIEKKKSTPPVRIRFREIEQEVVTWKDGFIKLLTIFDASAPGLLARIATEQSFQAVIATNGDKFPRSKAKIGDVFVNTHASAADFQNWCRKVAEIGGIPPSDFEFIMK